MQVEFQMKTGSKFFIVLFLLTALCGCNGGGSAVNVLLEVGGISGPDSIGEGSTVEFTVQASGDTGITCLWAVDPPTSGSIINAVTPTARFTANTVQSNLNFTITVTVSSDKADPVIRSKNAVINEMDSLVVGMIEGPDILNESGVYDFNITAAGDSGIVYEWDVTPPDIAKFTNPSSAFTSLNTYEIYSETPCTVSCTVNSDNYDPVTRTLGVTILDSMPFVVGEIKGPLYIADNSVAEYTVDVAGDHGIGYEWSVMTPGIGIFENPSAPVGKFIPNMVSEDIIAAIRVTVTSDHHPPTERELQIMISSESDGWVYGWGGSANDAGRAVGTDGYGNIFVTGEFSGEIDLDPSDGVDMANGVGYRDLYLSKFSPDGNFQWGISAGGNDEIYPNDLAVDPQGNVFLTGKFRGRVDFDPGDGEWLLRSFYFYADAAFLCKYSPDGDLVGAVSWGNSNHTVGHRVVTDQYGNAYVHGYFTGLVDFDPHPAGQETHQSIGSNDLFISKFDPDGNHLWAITWGCEYSNYIYDFSTDGTFLYVVARASYAFDLDPSANVFEFNINSFPGGLCYLSKFDLDGNFIWGWGWNHMVLQAVDCDSDGNIFLAGDFGDTVDFDPGVGTDERTAGVNGSDLLIKLNPDGDYEWGRHWGFGHVIGLACAGNNITIAGEFEDSIDFGFPSGGTLISAGEYDLFLTQFDTHGNFLFAKRAGGIENDRMKDISTDLQNNIFLTGFFYGTSNFDFDGGNDELDSLGYSDTFFLKLNPDGSL